MSAPAASTHTAAPFLDFEHRFKGYGIHDSKCRVRAFPVPPAGEHIVVVLTDLDEGTSVTNAAEQIAGEVLQRIVGRVEYRHRITWVEHYLGDRGFPEHFAFIQFAHFDKSGSYYAQQKALGGAGFSGGTFRNCSRQQLEQLIGGRFA